jgi:hypothetical protein
MFYQKYIPLCPLCPKAKTFKSLGAFANHYEQAHKAKGEMHPVAACWLSLRYRCLAPECGLEKANSQKLSRHALSHKTLAEEDVLEAAKEFFILNGLGEEDLDKAVVGLQVTSAIQDEDREPDEESLIEMEVLETSPERPSNLEDEPAAKRASPERPSILENEPAGKLASPERPSAPENEPAAKLASPARPSTLENEPSHEEDFFSRGVEFDHGINSLFASCKNILECKKKDLLDRQARRHSLQKELDDVEDKLQKDARLRKFVGGNAKYNKN